MLNKEVVKNLMEDLFYVHIEGDYKYSPYINCTLRTDNMKVKALCKLLARKFVNDVDSTFQWEDVAQLFTEILLEAMLWKKEKEQVSEEEFARLFLHNGTGEDIETDIASAKLYKMLETKIKQRKYELFKREEKLISERVNKVPIDIKNFNRFTKNGDDGEESIIDDIINAHSFDNNELFISEDTRLQLEEWIAKNKISLTKNEQAYLENPLSVKLSSSRSRYQKKIETKLEEKAKEVFGTSNGKIVELLIEKETIEKILDVEEFQESVCQNLNFISSLDGYLDLDFEILKDVNLGANKAHITSNKSLVAISQLLFSRLDKLIEKLSSYKINNRRRKELNKEKAKFDMTNILNIELQDSEEFPRNCFYMGSNGKRKSSKTPEYQSFYKIHKDVYENNLKLELKWYSWLEFARWLKASKVNPDERYYVNLREDGSLWCLPESLNGFFITEPSIQFITSSDKYKGCVKFKGKGYYTSLKVDKEEALADLVKLKNELKIDILESNKDKLSVEMYNILTDFKFDVR